MELFEKTLSTEEKFRGNIINVHVDEVMLPDGSKSLREIVEHSGGVTVIPVDEEGFVHCVRQYRYAYGKTILETPAGKLNEGEKPIECAVRELSEETGFTADEYLDLGHFYPSPGYCRENIYIYLALGLHRGEAHLDEGEFLEIEKIHINELFQMAVSGEIKDAKTLIAVMKARLCLEERGLV